MIPIRDHNPSGTTPIITYLLIVINSLVFINTLMFSQSELMDFVNQYALIPAQILQGENLHTLVTSMFLHGSIGHIVGNMLFLNIFGDNLEDTLGRVKYLIFYFLSGLGASFLQIATDPTSTIPNLGASGAIAGVMGGYLVLFPKHRVDTLVYFGFSASRITVPAYTMLIYWFIAQFFYGVGTLAIPAAGGVAYFAHVGGFITGFALVRLFGKPES